jgi:hypothetical protein
MMQQASWRDGFRLDVFPPCQDPLGTTEVDIGRGQIVETLVVTPQVVVSDELGEALFELTWQVVVLEQDLVLHGAVVALDLALGHRVTRLAVGVRHSMHREPGTELGGEIGRPVSLSSRGSAERDSGGVCKRSNTMVTRSPVSETSTSMARLSRLHWSSTSKAPNRRPLIRPS